MYICSLFENKNATREGEEAIFTDWSPSVVKQLVQRSLFLGARQRKVCCVPKKAILLLLTGHIGMLRAKKSQLLLLTGHIN